MNAELLTIQILSAKSILNVNNNSTNSDWSWNSHPPRHKAENHVHCAVNIIYIFSKKSGQNYTQTARGRRVTDAFLLPSLRLKISMNHKIGHKTEAGGDLVCYNLHAFQICAYRGILVLTINRVVTRYIFSRLIPHFDFKFWSLIPKLLQILIPEPKKSFWSLDSIWVGLATYHIKTWRL